MQMVSMESRHHELTAAATREAVRELDQLNHGRYVSFVKPRLHDTTGCQTRCQAGLTTGWMFL